MYIYIECCIHPLNDNQLQLDVHYIVQENQCSLKTPAVPLLAG